VLGLNSVALNGMKNDDLLGYTLVCRVCGDHHGYNLVNMVEPAWNFEPQHIEKLINLGSEVYNHVSKMYGAPLGGHEAE
jgi:hypothetical protein